MLEFREGPLSGLTGLQTAFNGSRLVCAVCWPGSNASQLALCVTRGVMPPRPRTKAVSHASAPTSTLSPAALAALLLAERLSSTRTASELLAAGIRFQLCSKPRVEWAPFESAGFGALISLRPASSVDTCSVCEARASAMRREGLCPWKTEKLLLLCGIQCSLATIPFS